MASRALELSLLVVAACSSGRDVSLTVVIDSNQPHEELEVIALPIDPASLRGASSFSARVSPRESAGLALLAALRDSAAMADERYQSAREALNQEVSALDRGNLRAADYARRYDAFRRRTLVAESIRVTRDRLRARIAPLEDRLSGSAALAVREEGTLRSNIDTASAMGRKTVVALTRGDTVRLSLADGTWWIGVSGKRKMPGRWTRVEIPHAGALAVPQ